MQFPAGSWGEGMFPSMTLMSTVASDLPMESHSVTSDACAKINLTLDIFGRREDGFHELRSLVIGVGLHDKLCCREQHGDVTLRCSDPALEGPENLVCRAARLLAEDAREGFGLHIDLEKHIPTGAGLGGGSSDAAAVLRLGNDLGKLGWSRTRLARLGATLGSDVPLFFSLPAAVITGRGEWVKPVSMSWSGWVLLVFAGPAVATKAVYDAFRSSDTAGLAGKTEDAVCAATTAAELTPLLSNHLEAAVFRVSPAVARTWDELHRRGWGPLRVSGAGSTLYRLFDEKDAACRMAGEIQNAMGNIATTVVAAPVGVIPRETSGATDGNHGCLYQVG